MLQKAIDSRDEFENNEIYKEEIDDMHIKADEIKKYLLDDNMVVIKGTKLNTIKQ